MVEWITRTFGGALKKLGGALGINEQASAGMVANLANNIAMFNILGEMDPKGKLLNVAFAVSAAFVFGDHLGFTAGVDQAMVTPVIIGKLVAGITALIVANLLAPKLLSKIKSAKYEQAKKLTALSKLRQEKRMNLQPGKRQNMPKCRAVKRVRIGKEYRHYEY